MFFQLKTILFETFIQKKHWEFIQGKLYALKLVPHKHVIPSVGHQTSSFFTSFLTDLVTFSYILEKLFGNWKKMKVVGRQAHKIDDFFTRLPNTTNSPTLGKISTKLNMNEKVCCYFFKKKLHHFRKWIQNLETPLFVGAYLTEATWIDPRNLLL